VPGLDLPGGEAPPGVLERKSFGRWPDPIVADCGLLASLAGKRVEFVRLYAWAGGSFQPIPFQIDENDMQGNKVYPSGEHANPEAANGLVDKGEELVFMARDCGDRVSPEVFPPGVEISEEMELQDPLTGGKGWVYVLYSESAPPPISGADYITYEPVGSCPGEGDCQGKTMENRYFGQMPAYEQAEQVMEKKRDTVKPVEKE